MNNVDVGWGIASACNMKCKFCYSATVREDLKKNDVGLKDWINFIDRNAIKTGGIYKEKHSKDYVIVLSPPCDLAIHHGKIKTDRILVCEIEEQDVINKVLMEKGTNADKKKEHIRNGLNNNFTDYYHWLPGNSLFDGGYINFRKVLTYDPTEFGAKFGNAKLKVQDYFVKSIMNRFSAYYARQGQPDFDFKRETKVVYENGCFEQRRNYSNRINIL